MEQSRPEIESSFCTGSNSFLFLSASPLGPNCCLWRHLQRILSLSVGGVIRFQIVLSRRTMISIARCKSFLSSRCFISFIYRFGFHIVTLGQISKNSIFSMSCGKSQLCVQFLRLALSTFYCTWSLKLITFPACEKWSASLSATDLRSGWNLKPKNFPSSFSYSTSEPSLTIVFVDESLRYLGPAFRLLWPVFQMFSASFS